MIIFNVFFHVQFKYGVYSSLTLTVFSLKSSQFENFGKGSTFQMYFLNPNMELVLP